ncbi:putative leucine-rich repeat-containing protein DDB_G0290503 isoform X2 [Pogonomyrmex barbatus]|uniref:Leucine-rich repeat-containing protein DDB_G0290503 isoform X2 n=1 Tax=Pogonomyrmex barbatus TaxID=144034 RepID=A0A6I9WMC7_9HYME|nr:putative leucine-rich repeat-containing protein DDB_G0290503 isoform X2 [Pogonomyrmex barbatus]
MPSNQRDVMSKMSKTTPKCEATTVKTKSSGSQQTSKTHNHVTTTPSKEVLLLGQDHIVEITVSSKKVKDQKHISPTVSFSPGQKIEKKKSTTVENKNWGDTFRQQNLLYMAKQSSKRTEDREIKRNVNIKKPQRNIVKHPVKSEEKHSKTSCCSSVLVRDCAVQCSEIFYNNNIAEFNPVYMLHLIKQLKELVNKKDKRTCEIFTEMEQILQKLPNLESKLEPSLISLTESCKKMKAMCESFILEREKLQSEISNRDERLKEADQKYIALTRQFEEAICKKNVTMSELRQQIENNERTIVNLKADLDKQIEIAEKNYIDNKYLTMEIHKLSELSSYKDMLSTDYRRTIKELQNQMAEQLKIVNEVCLKLKAGGASPQISLVNIGHACSSPTSSLSDKSWHDLLDISSVNPQEQTLKKDMPVREFELVSLLDGESSCTIMPDQKVTNDNGTIMQNNNENNIVSSQNVNDTIAKKSVRHSKKNHDKENDKMKKFTTLKERKNNAKNSFHLNASKVFENMSTKSTVSDVRKQNDMQYRKPVNIPSPLRDCPHPDWSDSSLPSISTTSNLDMVPSNNV